MLLEVFLFFFSSGVISQCVEVCVLGLEVRVTVWVTVPSK